MPAARAAPGPGPSRLGEVCVAFLRLGLVSFGGPVAHLGYFRDEFVGRRGWLSDADYADAVALCQFLPGPASSQVAFAIGMRRAGPVGGLAASVCFLLPSAALMIGFAYGVASLGDVGRSGWLHGLRIAAVSVVACAVAGMGVRLCPDWPRRILALAAAAAVLLLPGAAIQAAAIAACAFAGWILLRGTAAPSKSEGSGGLRLWPSASLAVFFLLLGSLPILAAQTGDKRIAVFDAFYRAGSLVFGGGHVVLPLLRTEIEPHGWISDSAFLAGYGAAQAMPGPLFSFAGYLGTLIQSGAHAWRGGVLALLAIFLPGWLLVAGAYSYWDRLRSKGWVQSALGGANAAVVGILLAALYRPLFTEGIRDARDVAAAVVGIVLLGKLRAPPWAVVLLAAAAGQWILR